MKIDRLIGILSLLLQKDKVTAGELAEKFEVSERTVLRDIDAINMAGIPVGSSKGKGGGFYIMEGYKVDRAILSLEDMQLIFAGLKGLDSISSNNRYKQLMDKLQCTSVNVRENIVIDLSQWDKWAVAEKFETIKKAIDKKQVISFKYYAPTGETERRTEPYHLVFQWSSWYVWGYCLLRGDYRMFKLTRITDLKVTDEKCTPREIPPYECNKQLPSEDEIKVTVKFDGSVKWRVIDEHGTELPDFNSDGSSILTFTWSDLPSLYEYILGFGGNAEILSPPEYREGFKELIKKIGDKYK